MDSRRVSVTPVVAGSQGGFQVQANSVVWFLCQILYLSSHYLGPYAIRAVQSLFEYIAEGSVQAKLQAWSLLTTYMGLSMVANTAFSESQEWPLSVTADRGLAWALSSLKDASRLVEISLDEPPLMAAAIVVLQGSSSIQPLVDQWFQRALAAGGHSSAGLRAVSSLVLRLKEGSGVVTISTLVSRMVTQLLPQKARGTQGGTARCQLLSWLESVLFFTLSASLECPALLMPSDHIWDLTKALQSSCLPFLLQLLLSTSSGSSVHQVVVRLLILSTRIIQAVLRYAPATIGHRSSSLIAYGETLLVHAVVPGPVASSPALFVEVMNLVNMLLNHSQSSPSQLGGLASPHIL